MGCWVQPLAARAAREPDPRWMMAALRGQGARSQVVMASAARSGEPEEAQADGAAPNRPGKKMKFSPIRRTAWVGGDASRTAPDRAGGARFGAMSMVLGILLSETRTDANTCRGLP